MAKHSLGGRTPLRGEKKEKATFSISPKNLNTLEVLTKTLGLPSRSETLEFLLEKEYKELQELGKFQLPPTHSAA